MLTYISILEVGNHFHKMYKFERLQYIGRMDFHMQHNLRQYLQVKIQLCIQKSMSSNLLAMYKFHIPMGKQHK